MIVKVGKTQFDASQFGDYTKAQFKKEFAGKLTEDIDKAWAAIDKARPRKKRLKSTKEAN